MAVFATTPVYSDGVSSDVADISSTVICLATVSARLRFVVHMYPRVSALVNSMNIVATKARANPFGWDKLVATAFNHPYYAVWQAANKKMVHYNTTFELADPAPQGLWLTSTNVMAATSQCKLNIAHQGFPLKISGNNGNRNH